MTSIFAKAGIAALVTLGATAATVLTASANDLSASRHSRICSPITAVQKARAMGLRHAHIENITPRRVVVEGVGRHGPNRVVFANEPGCPLIRS
ncbi:hypothetical protein PY650_05805 [Rhizobium calliandrae]|uniref:Antifreeze protein n=1 Tax=Rhizobium calliandrae TaxID=1312182 RepID=A0ABT7K9J9_9HYPH|nr:hypothetical protein [Rhizobium calliandrae]MDL2405176.1 hypothetical protein [Rhizobium calliandrae]